MKIDIEQLTKEKMKKFVMQEIEKDIDGLCCGKETTTILEQVFKQVLHEYLHSEEFKNEALKIIKDYLDDNFDYSDAIPYDEVEKFIRLTIKAKLGVLDATKK